MADGRFVSKSIATDYELNCLVSFEADYLFRACIPFLDAEGRMTGHPAEVKAKTCPLRENMTIEVVDRCLGELATAGLVLWYEVGGKAALWFKGFSTHQKGLRADREAPSKLPSPQSPTAQRITTLLRSKSELVRTSPAEVKVSEVKLSKEPQRADVVENYPASGGDSVALSRFELLEEAKRECGMGTWGQAEIRSASSVLALWHREGKTAGEVADAIRGARLLVDAGRVGWEKNGQRTLRPRQPFGLKALVNQFTLGDQGDGQAKRPFFDVAREEYIRQATGPPARGRKAVAGPERISVQIPNTRTQDSRAL